ncbi:MAG: acyl-CoA dehydrogenase family protein [Aeromicrobium sp.]|uniref:acyl-CoA dehydrogenase family protein n=1 Tax=Aeromicrobium sp. TaxID=1871063 RepID=UPI00262D3B9A|nr:acyl-CoA dehydrogenase family protein [Aeromicrobium sp.]MDF1704905.1 acyl-CoA dehydrogenase family protein [Aeromicrobium sp.]
MTGPDLTLALDSDAGAYVAVHDRLDEPSADVGLSSRELDVRRATRDVAARVLAPLAAEFDRTHEFTHVGVQALATAGLGGLVFPPHLGGTGDSNVAYAVAMEEVAAACPSTSLVFMTQMHAAYPILLAGDDDLQRRYIPGLLDGSAYGSLGITEPDAGSDVSSLATTATATDQGWSVSGQKTFITTGDRADVIICFATVDRTRGRDGITAFVLEGDWDGVSRGAPFAKLGMHGSSTAELFLDDVQVPRANLLGTEGAGWKVVMSSVVKSRISAAAQGVGIARAVYARTLLTLRALHGPRLPDDLTFALAEMRGQLLEGRLLLHAVARQVDHDSAVSAGQIGIMKQRCTDLGFRAAVTAVGLLGAYGDLADVGVERYLRDAKVTQIYDGTNEIQRLLIGREITRAMEDIL